MSRVGLKPIDVPSGVTVSFDDNVVTVKGPKGTVSKKLPRNAKCTQDGGVIKVSRTGDDPLSRSMHGLTRTLVANMVMGVTSGFEKELEIVGVGYRAEVKGKQLVLNIGFSHPVNFAIPEGIKIETPAPTQIKVSGIEKDRVGQVCADIRSYRPPEPYKGKGIKYKDEFIQRKAGKTAAGA